MSLLSYIKGHRKGKEANRLEREAMKDPFLADALEGYDSVKGQHLERIEMLMEQIAKKSRRPDSQLLSGTAFRPIDGKALRSKRLQKWSVAATIFLILALGGYIVTRVPSRAPSRMPDPVLAERQEVLADTSAAIAGNRPDTIRVIASRTQEVAALPSLINDSMVYIELPDSLTDTVGGSFPGLANMHQDMVNRNDSLIIAMQESRQSLDEVTVIGYGVEKKTMLTGSVSTIAIPEHIEDKKFDRYARRNLVRPADMECKKARGKVLVAFRVDENGRARHITVRRPLCPSADAEAIRLVEGWNNWPGGENEKTVEIKF